jgi:ribosomal protein L11 methyltransferase
MTHRWAAIEIEVSGDAQEIVGALLMEVAGCQGFMATPVAVTGYLPVDDRLENTLLALRAAIKESPDLRGKRDLTIRFVQEEDWANAWKQYFKPQRIGRRIVIKPTWESFTPEPDDLIVQIDPGMAFGTGLHATTRLCLRALEDTVTVGASVADVGTGSGILAIAAILLGASSVFATDNDPLAVRVARENVAVNAVQDVVTVEESSLPPVGPCDIVVANILADVIISMATELLSATKSGGTLIVSGIIENKADAVRKVLLATGFTLIETRVDGEWVAVLAQK